ncbi:MAG: hypothetical protein IT258_12155 [Saprospiraceae bacterium]|nr:hypothetical protein [Saprospiraceae bacterium]
METTKNIPWRKLAVSTAIACSILLVGWLGLEIAYAADFDSTRRAAYLHVSGQIKGFAEAVLAFISPLVQLAVALFVLQWLVKRFSPNLDLSQFDWRSVNIEKTLLVVVTLGFVVVSLKVGLDSLVHIKEMLLVLLGLYFGTMRRGM